MCFTSKTYNLGWKVPKIPTLTSFSSRFAYLIFMTRQLLCLGSLVPFEAWTHSSLLFLEPVNPLKMVITFLFQSRARNVLVNHPERSMIAYNVLYFCYLLDKKWSKRPTLYEVLSLVWLVTFFSQFPQVTSFLLGNLRVLWAKNQRLLFRLKEVCARFYGWITSLGYNLMTGTDVYEQNVNSI